VKHRDSRLSLTRNLCRGLSSRLARRQVKWVLLVALSIGVLLSTTQIATDYRSHHNALHSSIEQLFNATQSSATSAAWHLNHSLGQAVCEGALAHPAVSGCEIALSSDFNLVSLEAEPPQASGLIAEPLFGGAQSLSRTLHHQESESVGTLNLDIIPDQATHDFLRRSLIVVGTGILRAIVLAAAVLLVFYLLITRRVLRLSRHLQSFMPDEADAQERIKNLKPSNTEPDELSCLETSVDELMTSLDDKVEELKQGKSELEAKVAARTRELEQAMEALRYQAQTDPLTMLSNRRALFDAAQRYQDNWERYGERFSVVVLDIDYFKTINDRYGHATGDEVLRQIGELLRESIRPGDLAARADGEEFVLIIKVDNHQEALNMAERLKESLAGQTFGEQALSLTGSVGVATVSATTGDLDTLIRLADDAMYDAKRGGRAQVRSANQEA